MGSPKIITLPQSLSLYLQGVPSTPIVEVRSLLLDHEIDVPVRQLAAHARAGGDVREVGSALAEARLRGVPLDFARACALDLARDKRDPMQRPVNLVRRAAEPQEVFFDPQGPMVFSEIGKFTWRPRLCAGLKINLDTYIGGALGSLIEIRLKLALGLIYNEARDRLVADDALDAFLRDGERVQALARDTRFEVDSLERLD